MTEAEWWSSTAPELMLRTVRVASRREWWSFAVSCCRRIAHLLPAELAQEALAAAELFALGKVDEAYLRQAAGGLYQAEQGHQQLELERNRLRREVKLGRRRLTLAVKEQVAAFEAEIARKKPARIALAAFLLLVRPAAHSSIPRIESVRSKAARAAADGQAERRYQANLLRCLFGNPFRPGSALAEWRTPTVRALVTVVADGGLLEGAALADALEEAGCDDESFLSHCRSQAGHDPGCWMLALLRMG
jgi:hypothetical protein